MGASDIIRGRQTATRTLTNKSGGAVAQGDVVVIGDGTNDNAFTTTTTASFNARMVGVAMEAIANAAAGLVAIHGYVPKINSAAGLTRDHFLFTSTVAKEATGAATRAAGAFGQVLESVTDPEAMIWGMPDATVAPATAGFVGCKAYRAATQSVTNGVEVALALDSEEFDSNAFHDTVTNNSRQTIPPGKAGKYWMRAFAWSGANTKLIRFRKNGTTYLRGTNVYGSDGGHDASALADLAVADYVEAMFLPSATESIGHASAPEAQLVFEIALIGV